MTGNCLLCALVLMVRLRSLKLRVLWRNRRWPHFFVLDRDGTPWHFTVDEDLLPGPLRFLWFRGHVVHINHRLIRRR